MAASLTPPPQKTKKTDEAEAEDDDDDDEDGEVIDDDEDDKAEGEDKKVKTVKQNVTEWSHLNDNKVCGFFCLERADRPVNGLVRRGRNSFTCSSTTDCCCC